MLVPTRELAVQVRDEIDKLAHGRRVGLCAGLRRQADLRQQIAKLQAGAEMVVGTPGRVLDLIGPRGARLGDRCEIVVLDEADRMLDIGFRPDIEKILRRCPQSRQTLLLSATVAPASSGSRRSTCAIPRCMDFSPKGKAVDTIEQYYFTVDHERKFELLREAARARDSRSRRSSSAAPSAARTRCSVKLSQEARRTSTRSTATCSKAARDRVMKDFRAGDVRILVATDVVGRGIDVSSISHIINYDIPQSSDDYVHRVGRTGRMGREGMAFTFVTHRRRRRADADRNADQPAPEARRNRRLQHGGDHRAVRGDRRSPERAAASGAAPAEPAAPAAPKKTPPGGRPRTPASQGVVVATSGRRSS